MIKKTKTWKTSIMLAISLTLLMIAAASVNAEETTPRSSDVPIEIPVDDFISNDDLTDDILISPGPEEPLIIAPNPDTINEETDNLVIAGETTEKSEIYTIALPAIVIVAAIAGISVSIILLKRK